MSARGQESGGRQWPEPAPGAAGAAAGGAHKREAVMADVSKYRPVSASVKRLAFLALIVAAGVLVWRWLKRAGAL